MSLLSLLQLLLVLLLKEHQEVRVVSSNSEPVDHQEMSEEVSIADCKEQMGSTFPTCKFRAALKVVAAKPAAKNCTTVYASACQEST